MTIIIDEFQDLKYVDKAIFSDIQRVWDQYRTDSHVNLIVSGSLYSMMVEIFENEKQPLFNRPTNKIHLRPFPISILRTIIKDHNDNPTDRDMLTFYMLTGGTPLHVAALMDSGSVDSESMLRRTLSMDSVFLHDGHGIVASEFGKEYRTYFTLLQIISDGKERRKEMDDAIGLDSDPYLDKLQNIYFVERTSPIFSKPDSRNSRWIIHDLYMRFYFRFISPRRHYLESGRFDLLYRSVMAGLEEYEGRVLKDYFRTRIREEWNYTEVGGYWTRDGTVEVDIVVYDDIDHKASVIEVKRNPKKMDLNLR